MSKIVNFFTSLALAICGGVEALAVVLVSMIPLIELKGAIPVGVKFGMSHGEAYGWALLGSCLVCVPLYFIIKWLFRVKWFRRIQLTLQNKSAKLLTKSRSMEETGASATRITFYKALSVFIFVAIPIPLTGVWTGTFIAVLIGLKFRYAFPAIALGNAVAGGLILGLTALLHEHLDLLLFILFGIAVILFMWFCYKLIKVKPEPTENTPA